MSNAPITQAAPIRLVWSKTRPQEPESPALEEQAVTPEPTRVSPEGGEEETLSEVPEVCEAPGCQRSIEETEDFSYDIYGNGWCEHHKNRGQVLELGAYLTPTFPAFPYAGGHLLEEGQACWETFVKTASDEHIVAVFQAATDELSEGPPSS